MQLSNNRPHLTELSSKTIEVECHFGGFERAIGQHLHGIARRDHLVTGNHSGADRVAMVLEWKLTGRFVANERLGAKNR
jgi:hypothetical protein